MKVIYDPDTDTLTIIFSNNPIVESDETKPNIILDYDEAGEIVSLEIMDASKRVAIPNQIEYQVAFV